MNKIKEFYQSFGFIITFMFMSVLISAMFGKKFLSKFLLLVLASQLLFNVDKITELLKNLGGTKEIKPIKSNTTESISGFYVNNYSGDVSNGYISTYTGAPTVAGTQKNTQYSSIPRLSNGKVSYDIAIVPNVSIVDKSKLVSVPAKAPEEADLIIPTNINEWWEKLKLKTSSKVTNEVTKNKTLN